MDNAKSKMRALFLNGRLSDCGILLRVMAFALVVVGSIGLVFGQLGFVGIGASGAYIAYAVLVLVPIVTSGLLLGAVWSALAGFIAGAALLVHAYVQPLDYYEYLFVTPITSCVMLAVAGFLSGVLFGFVLRSGQSRGVRLLLIAIVSAVVTAAYALASRAYVWEALSSEFGDAYSYSALSGTVGNLGVQIAIGTVLAIAACIAADGIARVLQKPATDHSLRSTFRGWLIAVVALAFMVTASAGYAIVTEQEKGAAQELMESEVSYLCNQLETYEARSDSFFGMIESGELTKADMAGALYYAFVGSLSVDGLLDGYSADYDGTVLVFEGDTIVLSDDTGFPVGGAAEVYLGMSTAEWMWQFQEAGSMLQIVYDTSSADYTREAYGKDAQAAISGLSVGADRPISTQFAYSCAAQTGDYTVIMTRTSDMAFADRADMMMWVTLVAAVLLLMVFVTASRLLNVVVARRIDRTNAALKRIEGGDLAVRVRSGGSQEFASLSEGINSMVGALEQQIAETEARIDRELSAAKAIQASALPRIFPPFPDILRFDLYASMQPAREVGGDFYDFFLIGDCTATSGKLGFLVADVSGKSVPAALFMMAAKTQISGYLESGMAIDEAIENANRRLCENNDANMFVTVFAGVLDYGTGRVSYVNAGHNPPLLWQAGGWRKLSGAAGLPLGLFDGVSYKAHEEDLQIGDEFLLYTDGVTEAVNEAGEFYGLERLEALVAEHYYLHPREIIELVRRDVADFAGAADQADDITLLSLEYGVPPEISAVLVVPALDTELPRVNEFVHSELDRRLCPLRAQRQLDIAIEELFVNVAHYAYPDATPEDPGTVRISYTYSADPPSITVEIADDGIPFDPLAKPDAVTPDNIFDVQIGGLGVLMAKRSVDSMTYERSGGSNIVTIVKKW